MTVFTTETRWLRPATVRMLCLVVLVVFCAGATPSTEARGPVAFISELLGDVQLVRRDTTEAVNARAGALLFVGDHIRTGPQSWAEIEYYDDISLRIEAESYLVISKEPLPGVAVETEPSIFLTLGEIWVHVTRRLGRLIQFSVETPSAVAGVRGTIFQVTVDEAGATAVRVVEGEVEVTSHEGKVRLAGGEKIRVDLTGPLDYALASESDPARFALGTSTGPTPMVAASLASLDAKAANDVSSDPSSAPVSEEDTKDEPGANAGEAQGNAYTQSEESNAASSGSVKVPPGLTDKSADHPSNEGQKRRSVVHQSNVERWLERRLTEDTEEDKGPATDATEDFAGHE